MPDEKCFHSCCSSYCRIAIERDAGIVVNLSIEQSNGPFMSVIPRHSHLERAAPLVSRPLRLLPLEVELP